MILICYMLGYKQSEAVECCGLFRNMLHFEAFKKNEKFSNRTVYGVTLINKHPQVSEELKESFNRTYYPKRD